MGHAALDRLEAHQSVSWLNSGRTPNLKIKPESTGGIWVSVHDAPSSGVTVQVPLFAPAPGWEFEQRALLDGVRGAFPREVAETSPGVYEWRRKD
ncbi:DUF5959 family protein [Streptomyces sp. NBC_01537]|uniref:DUF5959 family protein n=1 Tax=Streptomyces sp. NBC_01537 TaxID=2903896 RepID=UPI00386DCB8A